MPSIKNEKKKTRKKNKKEEMKKKVDCFSLLSLASRRCIAVSPRLTLS